MYRLEEPIRFVSDIPADQIAARSRSDAFSFHDQPGFGFRGTHGVRVEQPRPVSDARAAYLALAALISETIHPDDLLFFDVARAGDPRTPFGILVSRGRHDVLPYEGHGA